MKTVITFIIKLETDGQRIESHLSLKPVYISITKNDLREFRVLEDRIFTTDLEQKEVESGIIIFTGENFVSRGHLNQIE